jgi:hypothetical protein
MTCTSCWIISGKVDCRLRDLIAQKLRDRARRMVYEMAAHECDLLREVLAKDCRMESVNSNITRQQYGQQQEGFSVNGSMSFQTTLK